MSDKDKIIEYELQIEDLLNALNERLSEFNNSKNLDDFEQGRRLAYTEIMDMIKTRHKMILDILSDE